MGWDRVLTVLHGKVFSKRKIWQHLIVSQTLDFKMYRQLSWKTENSQRWNWEALTFCGFWHQE